MGQVVRPAWLCPCYHFARATQDVFVVAP